MAASVKRRRPLYSAASPGRRAAGADAAAGMSYGKGAACKGRQKSGCSTEGTDCRTTGFSCKRAGPDAGLAERAAGQGAEIRRTDLPCADTDDFHAGDQGAASGTASCDREEEPAGAGTCTGACAERSTDGQSFGTVAGGGTAVSAR